MVRRSVAVVAVAVLGIAANESSAQPGPARDTTIDVATRTQIIETLISRLDAGYIFPEKAAEMGRDLRARLGRGDYAKITSAIGFADSLTAHLQGVSRDKHLRVRYSDQPPVRPSQEELAQRRERMRNENYGIGKPERLEGNVAYLELRTFGVGPEVMGAAMTEAMSAVADAAALIIDVRNNGGGSPFAVAFASSYLFGPDSVHLNSLYFRPADRTDHFWTRSSVPGKRFGPDKPLYVLTSRRTFSAAEEFTYNLQALKRATIVGDTTGGGAHPGGGQRLNDQFMVFVPSGRAINPITKTNWEGVGVRPDIAVPSKDAKEAAHRHALERLKKSAS
jgi:hypothetical protein